MTDKWKHSSLWTQAQHEKVLAIACVPVLYLPGSVSLLCILPTTDQVSQVVIRGETVQVPEPAQPPSRQLGADSVCRCFTTRWSNCLYGERGVTDNEGCSSVLLRESVQTRHSSISHHLALIICGIVSCTRHGYTAARINPEGARTRWTDFATIPLHLPRLIIH